MPEIKYASPAEKKAREEKTVLTDETLLRKYDGIKTLVEGFDFPFFNGVVREAVVNVILRNAYTNFDFPFEHMYIAQPPVVYAPGTHIKKRARTMPALLLNFVYPGMADALEQMTVQALDSSMTLLQIRLGQWTTHQADPLKPETSEMSDICTQCRRLMRLSQLQREGVHADLLRERPWQNTTNRLMLQDGLLRWCAGWECHIHRMLFLLRSAEHMDYMTQKRKMMRPWSQELAQKRLPVPHTEYHYAFYPEPVKSIASSRVYVSRHRESPLPWHWDI